MMYLIDGLNRFYFNNKFILHNNVCSETNIERYILIICNNSMLSCASNISFIKFICKRMLRCDRFKFFITKEKEYLP